MDIGKAIEARKHMDASVREELMAYREARDDPGEPEYFRHKGLLGRYEYLVNSLENIIKATPQKYLPTAKAHTTPPIVAAIKDYDSLYGGLYLGLEMSFVTDDKDSYIKAVWSSDFAESEGREILVPLEEDDNYEQDFSIYLRGHDFHYEESMKRATCLNNFLTPLQQEEARVTLNQLAHSVELYQNISGTKSGAKPSKSHQLEKSSSRNRDIIDKAVSSVVQMLID